MIPHPLTFLYCWLLGVGLSSMLGYVLQFASELCADAVRYGWIGGGAFTAALTALSLIATFTGGLFIGAAMRLLADKSWAKAGGWALLTQFLAALIGASAPLALYPAVGLALLSSPRFFLCAPTGCFLGAWLCHRSREESWFIGAEDFLRSWMFWERGGAE